MTSLFQTVLSMSVTGGYTILILVLLRFLLKRSPGWVSRLLWAAALFRLFCPFTFSAPVSLRTTARIASRTFSSRVRSSRCFSMKLSSSFPSSSSFPA